MECDVVCGAQKRRRGGEEGSHAILSVGCTGVRCGTSYGSRFCLVFVLGQNIDNKLQKAKIFLCVKIRPLHPVLTAEDSKLPALLLHHQSTTHRHHTAHPQPTKAIENHRAMPESATKRVCTNYDFVQVMSGT